MENVDRIKHGFEQLVVRFLEKTITDDELRRLRLLMEKSEERMLQFREIRQMWLQTKLLDAEKLYDTEGTLGVLKREFKAENVKFLCGRNLWLMQPGLYIVECRRIFFISELVADEGVSDYSV